MHSFFEWFIIILLIAFLGFVIYFVYSDDFDLPTQVEIHHQQIQECMQLERYTLDECIEIVGNM